MNTEIISLIVFGCLVGAALLGRTLSRRLPKITTILRLQYSRITPTVCVAASAEFTQRPPTK